MKKVIEWDPDAPDAFIQHAGGIYEKIKIPKVCFSIIDTPAFQRLNNIKQLGVVDKIYRQAVHTRFEHSLGVAELARRVMKKLKKKRNDITGTDMLCVIIAGLCHDLGHGPFSHTFDPVMIKINGKFRHEELSVKIFNYILKKEPKAKEELSEYLTETDFQFIREMIDPPASLVHSNNNEILKGRPVSKHYLYEIVANVYHGVDIDKLDYLAKDSHHTGVDVSVGPRFISRLISGIDIQEFDGKERLTFDGKLADEIPDVYNSRKSLYMKVYFHKKAYALEYQLHQAIMLALPHLKILGARGELKTLQKCLMDSIDIEAYIKLDDHILFLIKNSSIDHPDMIEAKKCIERIERREVHTVILKITICNIECTNALEQEIEKGIRAVASKIPNLSEKGKIIHKVRHYNFGKGFKVDPTSQVLYKSRSTIEDGPKKGSYENLKSETIVFVYGPQEISYLNADTVYRQMATYLKQNGIEQKLEFIFKNSN